MPHDDDPEVPLEDVVLTFDDGIPGFPEVRRFALVEEVPDSAFQLLQCVDDPDVAIIVTVPWLFFPEYSPEISDLEARELGLEVPEDAVVFNPVTLDAEHDLVYVNLLGPFVVNSRTRQGRQLVLTDSDHPTRAPLDLSEL
jgi:flagellar assembly factor FliW